MFFDTGDKILSENNSSQQAKMGSFVCNASGERYLFAINRNVFEGTNASTVFRPHFADSLFREHTFYVIAGTDSGLLYQYVKTQGIPKGSRYLFVELPQVLVLLEDVTSSEELAVTTGENWLEQAKNMGLQKFTIQNRQSFTTSLGVINNHYKGYAPFWYQLKEEFNTYRFTQNLIIEHYFFIICQIKNLTENHTPAICLKNTFKGKTAVVLSGGPSLDQLLPWVKQHRDNLLVIAVSRISHSLLQAGIQPDISVSIDPQPINLHISQDLLNFKNDTLLVSNNHLSPNLLSSWGGRGMFIGPRYPWTSSLEPENLPMVPGTTVTDSAYSLAVEMGVEQIILGGADFCLSQEGYSHASGSVERTIGPRISRLKQAHTVKTNSGMMAETWDVFKASAMSIDLQAQNAIALGCRTINPAPGAMRLLHVEHLSQEALKIEPMVRPACDILANSMSSTGKHGHTQFYKEVLSEVNRVLKELKVIEELSGKAIIYNRKSFAKEEQEASVHYKSKVQHIEELLNGKHNDITTFVRYFGVTRFISIRQPDEDKNNQDIEESCQLYHQAIIKTSGELIELLRQARTRTMSRLEEEKPQPNMEHLLDQWQKDEQPGRAIQWAQQHTSYISQLPDSQKQMLQDFQETFNSSMEVANKHRENDLKYISRLDRAIASKAKELFLSQNQKGLQKLLNGLLKYHDQKQASFFIPFVQGFLAELDNNINGAINFYQKTIGGAIYADVLMRLFELHIKTENMNAALDTLKTLSENNSTYSPMYADLLRSNGDIDSAVEIYTEYILDNPDDLDTVMKLGKLFLACNSAEGIHWSMSYILEKDPDNQEALKILNMIEITETPEESS